MASDFLQSERECRLLAKGATPEVKHILETMADDFHQRAPPPKSRWKFKLIAFVVVAPVYFVVALWLKTGDPVLIFPKVEGQLVPLHQPFTAISAFGVVVPDHWFGAIADSVSDRCRSPVMIYENDKLLGPLHSTYNEIAAEGMGRAAHWRSADAPVLYGGRSAFLFSSTDNTNPATNGRSYWAVNPIDGTHAPCPEIAPEIVPPVDTPHEEAPPPPPPYFVPQGKIVIQIKNFEISPINHIAVVHDIYDLEEIADTQDDKNRSPVLLYENDQLLGPAHSSHGAIAEIGLGLYSHWKTQGMVFSTSDNTDPSSNGRRYWVVVP